MKKRITGIGYYPIDKTDDEFWAYVGRYPKPNESLSPVLPVHSWDKNNTTGKKGWLYYQQETGLYFILKNDGNYREFPAKAENNQWWQFAGYHS